MTRTVLDPVFLERVTMVIDRARRSGANIPTRLNDAQLLMTKERETKIRVETVQDLIMEYRVWRPSEFLRLVNRELTNCTPADMHQAVLKFLEQYLEHVRVGSL